MSFTIHSIVQPEQRSTDFCHYKRFVQVIELNSTHEVKIEGGLVGDGMTEEKLGILGQYQQSVSIFHVFL